MLEKIPALVHKTCSQPRNTWVPEERGDRVSSQTHLGMTSLPALCPCPPGKRCQVQCSQRDARSGLVPAAGSSPGSQGKPARKGPDVATAEGPKSPRNGGILFANFQLGMRTSLVSVEVPENLGPDDVPRCGLTEGNWAPAPGPCSGATSTLQVHTSPRETTAQFLSPDHHRSVKITVTGKADKV